MSVYKKLNEARARFHEIKLQKTGANTFAKYKYFELGDFLIPALGVFREAGLCSVISFTADTATMTIRDVDKPDDCIVITSPMGSAALKGVHEVQNIGAVETYQRRYLWVAALEIVEHDAVDAQQPAAVREPDIDNILRSISGAIDLPTLKGHFTAAMQMLPKQHHAQLTAAKDARKAQLEAKETA